MKQLPSERILELRNNVVNHRDNFKWIAGILDYLDEEYEKKEMEKIKCRMCLKEINLEDSSDGVCKECWCDED
jgi:hypothetical protein